MNQTLVTQIISSVIGVIGALLTAKGFLTTDQASQLSTSILEIAGPLMTAGSIVYTAFSHTATSQISSTAKLAQVKRIVTNNSITALKVARPNVVHQSNINS